MVTEKRSGALDQGVLQEIIFWSVAAFILFWALGHGGLWASEGRWAEVTREMFLNGDFFHPTINGQPYFDKPLLTYWLVTGASFLLGGLNELAARLPSAVFGLLSVWGTRQIGRRLWSREVGYVAGWFLILSYGVIFWGRTAAAETENMAAITLAIVWYVKRRKRLNFVTFVVFYLICFIGAHTKGLTSVVVPILVVIPHIIRDGRWKCLFSLEHILALLIGIAVYMCPFAYADLTRGNYGESGLALMFRENVIRFLKPFDHKGPFYLYFYYLPLLLLPFTPLAVIGAIWVFRSYRKVDMRTRWIIEATVLIFVFFTASGSRRGYYILPILPFCALIGGIFVCKVNSGNWQKVGYRVQGALLALVVFIYLLSPLLWPLIKRTKGFVPPPGLQEATFLLGVVAAVIWVSGSRGKKLLARLMMVPEKLVGLVLCAMILQGGFFCWQRSLLDMYRTGKKFANTVREEAAGLASSDIAFYHSPSANIIFYLKTREPVKVLKTAEQVAKFACDTRGPRILICRRRYISDFASSATNCLVKGEQLGERVYPWMRRKGRFYVAWKLM